MPERTKRVADRALATDFEAFFRREHPQLLALGATMVGDREIARDVVQESLLRAHLAWAEVAGLERPGAWVRRVLINLCTDVTRRRGREWKALARSEQESMMNLPDPVESELWRAVRALPRLQRGVVALHYVDDLPVAEVAQVLGVSIGTVKTSLSRARSSLAPALRVLLPGEVTP
jgi:RNA polymerase sigma-70 factor (ECF subfamily)